jgi:hypothetical protein
MLGFLENQVLPELDRQGSAIKKRDNWALLVAQNDVHEQRVREESAIMQRRLEQEISDTASAMADAKNYPIKTLEAISNKLGLQI